MNKTIILATAALLAPLGALAAAKSDIEVMTMNQYLGAPLTPIVTAGTLEDFNNAVIAALQSVAGNNFPERAQALAETIADKNPDLVGLQEVYSFGCIPNPAGTPGGCFLFDAAFNDHLTETLDRLSDLEADYYVAATVQNLTIPSAGFPFPGLPVFLDDDPQPEFFVTVIDRDVILARDDVPTSPVPFLCLKPSFDGCNFDTAAVAMTLAGPIIQERGFVAVDATVKGKQYRFVNTHLEVQVPSPDPDAPLIQAAQATQLILSVNFLAPAPAPESQTLIVGDINSSPTDPTFSVPFFGAALLHPPYMQLANNTDLFGGALGFPYTDVWNLRPGKPEGLTCCQLADLSNPTSIHDERVDVIFSSSAPSKVKANVLDDEPSDKTASRLWPSDHSAVTGELSY
jgi:endonuclease/exonuclease/phosphatase family metal-dependent hydrolase